MILVSGATGFLGAYTVCRLLKSGHRVRALHREGSSHTEFGYIFSLHFTEPSAREAALRNLEWCYADVLDVPALEAAFNGVSQVYHCAAIVSFLRKHRDRLMQVNVEGTANMVNLALIHQVEAFCHVSSIAALGRAKDHVSVDERTQWVDSKLNTNYAISKYLAEMEVWRGMEEGLNAVIVNPGVILGAGDWSKGSCKLFELPWKQFPFYTTGVNGYVDVKDVARAMEHLMQNPGFMGKRYVLVAANYEMKSFMHYLADRYGKKRAGIRIRPWMAEVGWIFFGLKALVTGRDASITRETSRTSLKQFQYSSERIIRETGFQFTGFEETLNYICSRFIQDHTS